MLKQIDSLGVTEESGLYVHNISSARNGIGLLIVDPQNDFHPGGSLAIASADKDAKRISKLILDNLRGIQQIYVTLDSHQGYHIAHPMFWSNAKGEHPNPFTAITLASINSGEWKTTRKEHQAWGLYYVQQLEKEGNFNLIIWPEHCLIGTNGHNVRPIIAESLLAWEHVNKKTVTYIIKGNNSKTEHYSAIKAEVEVPGDKKTKTNKVLINQLSEHEKLLVCGQASSHCVNWTVRDIASNWDKNAFHKINILKNATSPVAGFEKNEIEFFNDMKNKGLVVTTCEECMLDCSTGSKPIKAGEDGFSNPYIANRNRMDSEAECKE